ncbi:MAG TPA: methyltransferase domain-containing protein [Ktedonobacteraceae bacterium]|nr:methyltransferase domain-containing protein [Ktedonobacteraceae bacterium]
MSNYIFDNAGQQVSQRFTSLETLYDPWTIRHLEATGIGTGWQCWEVGGGGGSIATWLGERCGPTGYALVTDIDPRYLVEIASLDHAHIDIQRHDIGTDSLPARTFDLIHARLVLIHVPAREAALQRLVMALKPGGWLVVEDFDSTLINSGFPTADAADTVLFQRVAAAQNRLMAARSGELALAWGRSLYRRLRAHGLVDVDMEGYLTVRKGGSPGARLHRANFEQIREEVVNAGFITDEEIAQALTLLDDPDFAIGAPIMFTAWGRRAWPMADVGSAGQPRNAM